MARLVELDVAARRPAQLLKPLTECAEPSFCFWIALRNRHQDADPAHPIGLLRPRGEGPRRGCAAEEPDELAPFQLAELHLVHCKPGPDGRISNLPGSVSGLAGTQQPA